MTNNHEIFRDRIQAWLSNQLTDEDLMRVENHLADCAECTAQAASEKELWEMLGQGDVRSSSPVPSVWPEVRERTVGSGKNGAWFFGGGMLVRTSLAVSAVAAGLMVSALLPGLSGTATAENIDDSMWISESSWLDESATDGLAAIWLDPGFAAESDGS